MLIRQGQWLGMRLAQPHKTAWIIDGPTRNTGGATPGTGQACSPAILIVLLLAARSATMAILILLPVRCT